MESNQYKAAAQQAKAEALSVFLIQTGIPAADLKLFGAEQWKLAAQGARVNPPSAEVIAMVERTLTARESRPAKSVFPKF
jgi:hypothetical protein